MATGKRRPFGRRGETARGVLARWGRLLRKRPAALDPFGANDRPGDEFEHTWRLGMKRRVIVVLAVLACWIVGIQARFVQLQVFQQEWLAEKARSNQQDVLKPEAPRGDIVDRHNRMLAFSVDADALYGDALLIEEPETTAAAVCAALGDCSPGEPAALAKALAGSRRYVPIRSPRAVSPVQVQRVAALRLPGIALGDDTRRYYPHAELAAHVLGFVGAERQGQAGIELVFDRQVRGEAGRAVAHLDARRQRLETRVEQEPVPGAKLELTIDLTIQHIVERELKRGVLENRAVGGSAVVMNPMTGEVLALANYPTFNPNTPGRSTAEERRNRAVQNYEPGSTFKIVTAAAALESGIVTPTDQIDCRPGVITMPGRRITEAGGHNYGVLSFEDVIVKSSNVGAIRVGWRTGADRIADYVARFGFGRRNTRELPGVEPGIWSPAGLNESGLASVSMGYQIGVTPLQMAAAASVVANGGLLMRPRFVRAVVRNGQREEQQPEVVGRAIQPETAATLTAIMEAVTERGTAKAARLARYQVAGKTGTANKVVPGLGYADHDYYASFVGFVPSRRPAFTVLVVIDTPRANGHYGGGVAAPVFKRIAEAGLQHLGIPPTIDPLPPVIVADARATSFASRMSGPIVIPAAAPLGGPALMPDVRGLSAREAVRVLAGAGVIVRPSGSGLVVDQSPAPGQPVASGTWGAIHLGRQPPRPPDRGGGR